jgi:peptidoglycan biosynthesis protein MviN/MurJ (putative lipid II flippase)
MSDRETGRSIGERIIRATVVVGIAHVIFKLISVVQAIIVGQQLDDATFEKVYAFAFEGCIFMIFLIGEEVIGPTFLPVFMGEMAQKDESAAWRFVNTIVTLHVLVLAAIVTLIVNFPGPIVQYLTFWDPVSDPEQFQLARNSLAWLAPSLICLSLGSTTYMLLNGYKRFFLAALGDASWKFCVLICVIIGMAWLKLDYHIVIVGLLIGSVAKLGTHLIGLVDKLRRFRIGIDLSNPAVAQMLLLMLPLLAGIMFAKVRDFYNNITILSYLDTAGLIKANFFGRKLYTTIGWLVPYALSIAMFPFFCELVARGQKEKFGELLTRSGRLLLSVFIPLAFVCLPLSQPACSLLLEAGKFSAQTADWTAISMACYTLVLPAAAIEYMLMQAFFAHRRMVAVTLVGIGFSLLSMAISSLGIFAFGASGVFALVVVALGFALSRTLKSVALVILLRRNAPVFPAVETIVFVLRVVAVGLMVAMVAMLTIGMIGTRAGVDGGKGVLLLQLAAAGATSVVTFVAACKALRVTEPFEMCRWALEKIRSRSAGGSADQA